MRGWTLAVKNMERLLEHTYPGVLFELARPGNSNTNITVQWMGYPDTPQGDEVKALLKPFAGETVATIHAAMKGLDGDERRERIAFQKAYGGSMQVSLKRGLPSNEDMAAWRERKLGAALNDPGEGKSKPRL